MSEQAVNSFERTLLAKLTAGDHPVLAQLRTQLELVRVRQRTVSDFGLKTEFELPLGTPPVEPSCFSLSDIAFSVVYGWAHSVSSWGPPNEGEPGSASLLVENGLLARLEANLVFQLWPVEEVPRGSAKHQIDPAFAAGPDYVDEHGHLLTQRDVHRISSILAT